MHSGVTNKNKILIDALAHCHFVNPMGGLHLCIMTSPVTEQQTYETIHKK
jgi:hypothetical protein